MRLEIGTTLFVLCAMTRSAIAACPPPNAPPSTPFVLNVKDFGAIPNDGIDDQPAIQAAIDCAASLSSKTVYVPGGLYILNHALVANVSDLTIAGSAGTVLYVNPASSVIDTAPEAILVNLVVGGILQPVNRVTIRDLYFYVRNGTNSASISFGVIQLNFCVDCLVSNVNLTWDPAGGTGSSKPRNVDGIVMSQGSSGAIRGSIVDGMPKVGIYLAQGTHDVTIEGCEVRHTDGPIGRCGISVTGATKATIAHCHSHDNAECGLFIGTNSSGVAPPAAARDITVVGGQYYGNGSTTGEGIMVSGGAISDPIPRHIQLSGVSVFGNIHGPGIQISGAEDVEISSPIAYDNGQPGVLIETPLWGSSRRTARVLVSNAQLYDNGCSISPLGSGVQVNSADLVTISGGKMYASADPDMSACTQPYGVLYSRNPAGQSNSNVRILDVDTSPVLTPTSLVNAVDALSDPSSGYYRLQGSGAPGAMVAPNGSQYTDLTGGQVYRRVGGAWVTP